MKGVGVAQRENRARFVSGFGEFSEMKAFFSKVAAAGALVAVTVSNAFAVAQVYTGITTAITDEIAAAMPVVLTVGGTLLGIGVAFRLLKRGGRMG